MGGLGVVEFYKLLIALAEEIYLLTVVFTWIVFSQIGFPAKFYDFASYKLEPSDPFQI